ncbi:MAG TPA: hypothetical protein VFJ14_03990, partial [Nocardioidaceae bacterium]|nr:hypothetical protein [Nocardioidaceae bacterium]
MQTEGFRAPRRPGRPLRLPGDHSPLPGMRVASAPRIAWLVATSRILRGGPHLQRRDATAEAITGLGHKADVTRLSRWESGSQPVPPRILDAYERLLGLEPGHLTCTAAGLKRALDPSARRGKLLVHRAPQSHTELEEVCATIEAGDHTGLDWLRLAAGLEAGRKLSFADERVDFLTRALLPEVARAEQMAHTRRFEASRSLLTHSGCRPAMLRAIGSFVTAAGAQVVEPAVVLLQEVEDSQACALLLRMLSGRRGPLRRGAAWALAGKLNRNHVGADDLAALGRVVPELLARRPQQWFPAEVVDVLAAMDAPHQEKVLHPLRGNPLLPGLRQSLATGELVAAERSRPVAAGVAQRAEAGASMPVDGDEMLPRLVREALFHVHRERRHQ